MRPTVAQVGPRASAAALSSPHARPAVLPRPAAHPPTLVITARTRAVRMRVRVQVMVEERDAENGEREAARRDGGGAGTPSAPSTPNTPPNATLPIHSPAHWRRPRPGRRASAASPRAKRDAAPASRGRGAVVVRIEGRERRGVESTSCAERHARAGGESARAGRCGGRAEPKQRRSSAVFAERSTVFFLCPACAVASVCGVSVEP